MKLTSRLFVACIIFCLITTGSGLFGGYITAQYTGTFTLDQGGWFYTIGGVILAIFASILRWKEVRQQQPERPWKRPRDVPFQHL